MKWAVLLVLVLTGLAFGRWAFRPSALLPRYRVGTMRLRLRLRLHPARGHARLYELWLRWGRLAAFRESGRVRPSLTARQRLRHPQEHSLYLGRAQLRHTCRVSVQEHGALVGPPRSNKSAVLSRLIMSAPGAVVSTSSKPDMFNLTSGLRERRGPLYVFNPMGLGGIPSTVRWSPLAGCLEAATAIRRADAFAQAVGTGGTDDGSFWSGTASGCLRAMFRAGALASSDMRLVSRWARGQQTGDAIDILDRARDADSAGALSLLVGPAEKTAETVRAVLNRALAYMTDPALAAATLPGEHGGFDIDEFLMSRGTLYMIAKGNGEDCTLGPLFAALASEIQFRATQLGSRMPGGRLDPPLLMALDEVTQICPVPLPLWLADSGGQGVQIWSAFHGVAQLRSRWKASGAQTVLDTSNVKVFMPGLADTETLDHASKLCGQAAYREHGQEHYSRHDSFTPDMIRQLPPGFALLLRSGYAPVVSKLAKGWKDRGYKRARRQGWAVASLQAAPPARISGPGELVVARLRAAGPLLDGRELAEVLPPAGNGHNGNGRSHWSKP